MGESKSPTSLPAGASDRQLVAHYQQLRDLARRLMLAERHGHSLAATDLAHEAWIRLVGSDDASSLAPDEFRRRAALVMRHLLIDRARARATRKRGRQRQRLSIDALHLASTDRYEDLLAVDEAIEKLAAHDAALAELVRLRFFAGLTIDDVATALGLSPRTVDRDWALARSFLFRLMEGED